MFTVGYGCAKLSTGGRLRVLRAYCFEYRGLSLCLHAQSRVPAVNIEDAVCSNLCSSGAKVDSEDFGIWVLGIPECARPGSAVIFA